MSVNSDANNIFYIPVRDEAMAKILMRVLSELPGGLPDAPVSKVPPREGTKGNKGNNLSHLADGCWPPVAMGACLDDEIRPKENKDRLTLYLWSDQHLKMKEAEVALARLLGRRNISVSTMARFILMPFVDEFLEKGQDSKLGKAALDLYGHRSASRR